MRLRAFALLVGALSLGAPASGGTPLQCADPCRVVASGSAYILPVNEIASGTTVEFTTESETHPTTNELTQNRCFMVRVGASTSGSVRFDVVGDAVQATQYPGTPLQQTAICQNAVRLETGSYVLRFHCLLHPWMNGALTIDPSA